MRKEINYNSQGTVHFGKKHPTSDLKTLLNAPLTKSWSRNSKIDLAFWMTLLLDFGWIQQVWCSVLFPTSTKRHSEFAALIHTSHFPTVTATKAQEVFRASRNTKLVEKKKIISQKQSWSRIQGTRVLWRGTMRMSLKENFEKGFYSGGTILPEPAALSTSQLYSVLQQFIKYLLSLYISREHLPVGGSKKEFRLTAWWTHLRSSWSGLESSPLINSYSTSHTGAHRLLRPALVHYMNNINQQFWLGILISGSNVPLRT